MRPLKPGQIAFYENWIPALDARKYELGVQQEVTLPASETFKSSYQIAVEGPRFSLKPDDIQSVFPPPDGYGRYGKYLPQVVFNRRTLPWERRLTQVVPSVDETAETPQRPWMALLLMDADEAEILCGPPSPPKPQRVQLYTEERGNSLLNPPHGIRGPQIDPASLPPLHQPADSCLAIDLPVETFAKILPSWDELSYLSHVRVLDTWLKETSQVRRADIDDSSTLGWYAATLSNRFPKRSTKKGKYTENVAYLVSMEGFEPDLLNRSTDDTAYVRMVCLKTWRFYVAEQEATFSKLMEKVRPGTLRIKPEKTAAESFAQEAVATAFSNGYTALNHTTRVGGTTASWYRGPLVPLDLKLQNPRVGPYQGADAALRYDPDNGLFDVSYAAAWQLGQLLALQNPQFSVALYKWRRSNQKKAIELSARQGNQRRHSHLLGLPKDPLAALDNAAFHDAVLRYWQRHLGPRLRSDGSVAAAKPPIEPDSVGVPDLLAAFRGDPELWPALLDEKDDPPASISSWLAHLKLLHGIPFGYLVPEPLMLPEESVQLFRFDRNWIDTLCDGALSIGRQTTMDMAHDRGMSPLLHAAAETEVPKVRRALWKTPRPMADPPSDEWSGFLMRSTVVAQFPGLEVRGYADAEGGGEPLEILRSERLADDVLLCIFGGVVENLQLQQPGEGLQFGADFKDANAETIYEKLHLRYLGYDDQPPGTEIDDPSTEDVPIFFKESPPGTDTRVVDIIKTEGEFEERLTPFLVPSLTSAELAVEMVEGAGQQIYKQSGGTRPSVRRLDLAETRREAHQRLDQLLRGTSDE